MANTLIKNCEHCVRCKDKVAKLTGEKCSVFPFCPAEISEEEARQRLTRRAAQRATQDDAQIFANVDPAELAGLGYFDKD